MKADRRSRARFAVPISSRTVTIRSSTVSAVKEASPSTGQTQACTLGTRIEIPSSSYSKVVEAHSFDTLWSPQNTLQSCAFSDHFSQKIKNATLITKQTPLAQNDGHR